MRAWTPTKILGVWLILGALPGTVGAAEVEAGRATGWGYSLGHWKPGDGLPQNGVRALAQTRDGYLWVGTLSGLARFDGMRFKVFDHRNTPQMTHDSVNDLAADAREDSLWIATGSGLLHYYDRHFERYGADEGLPDSIPVLSPARNGGVWCSPHPGEVALVRKGRVATWKFGPATPENAVRQLCEERPSELLVLLSAEHGTACSLDLASGALRPMEVPGERADCHSFLPRADGSLWFCTSQGIWRGKDTNWSRITSGPAGSTRQPKAVYPMSDGQVWVTQTEGGRLSLQRLVENQLQPFFRQGFPEGADVTTLLEGREGELWVATKVGLFRLAPTCLKTYSERDGLGNDEVLSVAAGSDGTIWAGSVYGIYTIKDGQVAAPDPPPGLTWPRAEVMLLDHRNVLWMGWPHPPSLQALAGGKWELRWPVPHGFPESGSVRALFEDREGRIWVSGGPGVFCRDGDRWRAYSTAEGLAWSDVRAIHESRRGDFWFGTYGGGLYRLRAGRFTAYRTDRGEHNNRDWWIHEDADGILWVASEDGLNRFVPPDDTPGPGSDGSSAAGPGALPPGRRAGAGAPGRFFTFTTLHGLGENVVNNIQEDASGFLWLSGLRGIYRVSRRQLNEVAAGSRAQVECMALGESDGMPNAECNGGDNQPAGCTDPQGRIWFPTIQGLVMIDPAAVRADGGPPPVALEQVKANDQVVFGDGLGAAARPGNARRIPAPGPLPSPAALLNLPPGAARTLEIRYTANSFASPQRVRFKYRLAGYDRDWVSDDQNRRVAFYTNLRPGHYSFEVTACDSHGRWNVLGARLAFYLAPYFWQTWPFYLAIATLVTAAGAGLHSQRVRRLAFVQRLKHERALAEERTRIARDLHDQLGSDLTRLALDGELAARSCQNCLGIASRAAANLSASDAAQAQPAAALAALGRIQGLSASVRDAFRSLDEMIWAVNPKQDTLAGLANYLCEYTLNYLRSTGIRCRFDVPADLPARALRTGVRHELFLVIKEGLHNTIKHAGASEVRLRVSSTAERLELELSDNGRGFDESLPQAGPSGSPSPRSRNGLANMRQRAAAARGHLEITSAPGRGTQLKIVVPLTVGRR